MQTDQHTLEQKF